MTSLVLVLGSLALVFGFLALVAYERRRGVRFLASDRSRLDATVGKLEFILANVDFGVFLREEIRHFAGRVGHSIAHSCLLIVRSVERLLTSLVRRLRAHPEVDTAPRETAREFVKVLSEFKSDLKSDERQISEISDTL